MGRSNTPMPPMVVKVGKKQFEFLPGYGRSLKANQQCQSL